MQIGLYDGHIEKLAILAKLGKDVAPIVRARQKRGRVSASSS
jgi:hypothetical protein